MKTTQILYDHAWCFHTRARQRQENDKANVEPVHSYYIYILVHFHHTDGLKARVHWADLPPVRLFWRVLSATVTRLSDGTELTVSTGRLAKSPCPLSHFFLVYISLPFDVQATSRKTWLSGHGPLIPPFETRDRLLFLIYAWSYSDIRDLLYNRCCGRSLEWWYTYPARLPWASLDDPMPILR